MADKHIGNYKIIKQIGAGGMAQVYYAVHKDVPNLKVVLKVLSDPRLVERFKQEADKLALFDKNPNICKIKHFFTHGRDFVIAMEYIDGPTLKEILEEKGKLAIPEALRIIIDILEAMEPPHKQGIFHRDIKPGNIMFTQGGLVKIIDFGIAKGKTDQDKTVAGTSVGTPTYMAPEQYESGQDLDYSKSDIYAIGTMLFQMLTGELPFKSDNEFVQRDSKLFDPPKIPSRFNGEISKELDRIIIKSLAREPGKRFASVTEMRTKLQQVYDLYQREEGSGPPRDSRPVPFPSGNRKRLYIIASAGIVLIAAFLLLRPHIFKVHPPSGEITLILEPESDLYIDGVLVESKVGRTSVRLETGRHTILVRNEEALFEQEIADTVTLAVGQTLNRTYRFKGKAEITVTPWGDLLVDDFLIQTRVSNKRVPLEAGRHVIRVINRDAREPQEFVDTVEVAANQTVSWEHEFKMPSAPPSVREEEPPQLPPAYGSLIVSSRPPRQDIYIDGQLMIQKTPYTFSLSPGPHTVKIVVTVDGREFERTYQVTIVSNQSKNILFKPDI